MEEIKQFIEMQNRIYRKFSNSSVRETGLMSFFNDAESVEKKGSYAIVVRHSDEITEGLGEFSEKVSKLVPAIYFDQKNAHTTIMTCNPCFDFVVDNTILEELARTYYNLNDLFVGTEIDYFSWLINEDTIIAAGNPNDTYVAGVVKVADYDFNVGFRRPWGAHITTNRFKEKRDVGELGLLFDLIDKTPPLGLSKPTSVDVGYYHVNGEGFTFCTYERFSLEKRT